MLRQLAPRTAAFVLFFAAVSSHASAPVTLTDANLEDNAVTYSFGPSFVPNIPAPVIGDTQCDTAHPCDDTTLTINVSPAISQGYRVKALISWPFHDANADYDLYIFQGEDEVARSAGIFDPEIAIFPAINGDYDVRVIEFDPQGNSLTAKIYLEPIPVPAPAPVGVVATYDIFPAPADLGQAGVEPSLGVNWNTGVVASQADTDTLFTKFDDSTTPATATWEKHSSPFSVIDFDPILWTDHDTGRTIVSLLVSDGSVFVAGCSDSSHTDDDGASWSANDGCSHPAGSDHQGLGGGPYSANSRPPLAGLLYPNAVYYCAQEPGALLFAPALCARSDDGGVTYGPAVAAEPFSCLGTHGHPKVAPDGTVYLPHRGCASSTDVGNGVVVSLDNGTTWLSHVVPGSTPSLSDPSVAVGINDVGRPAGQVSNTVYLGYCDGDGRAKVAVSRDQGDSWNNVYDVGAAKQLKNCVFAEMVAGDDSRAAMFFLGTPDEGDTQSDDYTGIWHAYVATTFDGGATWGLYDATPNDPVQIGKVCLGGISCTGGRNLYDFNDATLDKEGRLVGVFGDGCLPPECDAGKTPDDSRKSFLTIIRQSGGPRLFAEFDPPGTVTTPPPLIDPPTANPPPVTNVADSSRFGGAFGFGALMLFGAAALRRRKR